MKRLKLPLTTRMLCLWLKTEDKPLNMHSLPIAVFTMLFRYFAQKLSHTRLVESAHFKNISRYQLQRNNECSAPKV